MNTNDLEDFVFPNVPHHTREALDNYWKHGWEPGGFLMSMLVGDLYGAAARADHVNKGAIGYIAEYIVNEAPYGSWGSAEVVRDWCNKGVAFKQHEKHRVVDILSTP